MIYDATSILQIVGNNGTKYVHVTYNAPREEHDYAQIHVLLYSSDPRKPDDSTMVSNTIEAAKWILERIQFEDPIEDAKRLLTLLDKWIFQYIDIQTIIGAM